MNILQNSSRPIYVQLSLFPETKEEQNAREIAELRSHCDKLRKSLYAKNGQLAKAYSEIKHELEQLKAAVCKAEEKTSKQGSLF